MSFGNTWRFLNCGAAAGTAAGGVWAVETAAIKAAHPAARASFSLFMGAEPIMTPTRGNALIDPWRQQAYVHCNTNS
jgi:hypothetical protein